MRWACRDREAGPKLIRRSMATIASKRIRKAALEASVRYLSAEL